MSRLILFIICSLPWMSTAQDCALPMELKTLDTPRASFMHSSGGGLWWDGANAQSKIDDPALSTAPASVAFAGGLWLGAVDEGGNLIIRSSEYDLHQGYSSYASGPITEDFPNPLVCELFNRIWEVKEEEILNHQADWADNQSFDHPIPESIKLWPGKGNTKVGTDLGVPLPDMNLAPFVDINGDGKYAAADGDYPEIRNAKIAHWWMFNDAGPDAISANGEAYFDVSVLAYSYDNDQSSTTYFYEYEITNRSQQSFEETRLSLWLDGDLGCYTDDYIGCKPSENLAYVYNTDAIDGQDGTTCPNNVQSFDLDIPLFGIKILNGTDRLDQNQNWIDNGMHSLIFINGGIDWVPGTGPPELPSEYWNYMNARWRDDSPLNYGGGGYNPAASDTTQFAFPDDPNDPNGWSMCTANLPQGDRRLLINSGPFPLAQGQAQKFAFAALVTGAIPDYPCPSLTPLIELAQEAQQKYDDIISSTNLAFEDTRLKLFPNPTSDHVQVEWTGELIADLQLWDMNGKMIYQILNVNKSNCQLDFTHELANGIYLLKVNNSNGKTRIRKLILQ